MFQPAVIRVRMPSSTQIFAFNDLVVRNTGRRINGWRVLTHVATLITYGSAIALGFVGIVTSNNLSMIDWGCVVQHWARTIISIWAQIVTWISVKFTQPIPPAVELVRFVSIT